MKNQNEIDKYLDELIDKAEEDIEKLHAQRMKKILKALERMFANAKDGILTRAQAQKYNRMEKEIEFMANEMVTAYSYMAKEINKLMQSQYQENYYRSAHLYEYTAQQKMGFGMVSPSTIQRAITNPIELLTLPKLMQSNRNQIIRKIRIVISEQLQVGADYFTMAREIKKVVNFSSYKAQMVARTEAHRAQTLGRMDSAKQAAKHADMKKMWDSTLDSDTRKSHRKLDGQIKEHDELFKGLKGKGLAPGLMSSASENINCRCALNYTVNGIRPQLRRARKADGKTEVIPWTQYEDWYKNRIVS